MSLDVQRIKEYNRQLRECKDKSSKITAEMEFNNSEIQRLCVELSNQLGIEVTPDNVVSIYKEREAKLENTLSTGEEILRRIKEEEQSINNSSSSDIVSSMGDVPSIDNMMDNSENTDSDGFNTYNSYNGNIVNTTNGQKFIQPIFGNSSIDSI